MYNLNYTPTTLEVQSCGEIISGGTGTKKVEYHWHRHIRARTISTKKHQNQWSYILVSVASSATPDMYTSCHTPHSAGNTVVKLNIIPQHPTLRMT
jgi:hypothetical protein